MSRTGPIADDELAELLGSLARFERLLIAISGGADSMALMHLLRQWASSTRPEMQLHVATVDHGLRPQSAAEAQWVASECAALGLPHVILAWHAPKPATGIQEAARAARYRLLAGHARASGCGALVTAHHQDDQAETVLMRLARGSGVDGLAAMAAESDLGDGLTLARPLLGMPKARLIATLQARGVTWLEDPSNANVLFERVRLREARAALESIGLSPEHLAQSALRLGRARRALEGLAHSFMAAHVATHDGAYLEIEEAALRAAGAEIAIRVLRHGLSMCGGQEQAPRLAKLEALWQSLASGAAAVTLGGCLIEPASGRIAIYREPGRAGLPEIPLAGEGGTLWDNRFEMRPLQPLPAGARVRALGADGLARLKQLAGGGTVLAYPRRAALTLPSVWQGEALLAVPHIVGLLGPATVEKNQQLQALGGLLTAYFRGSGLAAGADPAEE
jgi:tRNA(Ile)-lysidine synthase